MALGDVYVVRVESLRDLIEVYDREVAMLEARIHGNAPPTVLSALAAEVAPERQGRGVSRLVIGAMADVAGKAGLEALVAPVRPSWKDRYPLIPIEQYATWLRDDGLPFDPWLRVHVRLGATTLRPNHAR